MGFRHAQLFLHPTSVISLVFEARWAHHEYVNAGRLIRFANFEVLNSPKLVALLQS